MIAYVAHGGSKSKEAREMTCLESLHMPKPIKPRESPTKQASRMAIASTAKIEEAETFLATPSNKEKDLSIRKQAEAAEEEIFIKSTITHHNQTRVV